MAPSFFVVGVDDFMYTPLESFGFNLIVLARSIGDYEMAAITGNLEMSGVSREQMDALRRVLEPLMGGVEESIRHGENGRVAAYKVSFNWEGDDAATDAKIRLVEGLMAPAGLVDRNATLEAAVVAPKGSLQDLVRDMLAIPSRARGALVEAGVTHRGILLTLTDKDFLSFDGVGREALKATKQMLARDGWEWDSVAHDWLPDASPSDVPNTRGITLNGELATQKQVDALDQVYKEPLPVAEDARGVVYRQHRLGSYVQKKGGALIAPDDLKLRVYLAARRMRPDDMLEGWESAVTYNYGKQLPESLLHLLNTRCDEVLDAELVRVIQSRNLGVYVGDIVNISASTWERKGVKHTPVRDRLWKAEGVEPRYSMELIGWFPPKK